MELTKYSAPLIFGAVDCQGFRINGKFSATELCFKKTKHNQPVCFVFRPKVPFFALSTRNKQTVFWLTRNLHGLPYDLNTGTLPQDMLIPTIQKWYEANKVDDKPYLAVMNDELQEVLTLAGVPFVGCGGNNCLMPATTELMQQGRAKFGKLIKCYYHVNQKRQNINVCAKEKAFYIDDWLTVNKPLFCGLNIDDVNEWPSLY